MSSFWMSQHFNLGLRSTHFEPRPGHRLLSFSWFSLAYSGKCRYANFKQATTVSFQLITFLLSIIIFHSHGAIIHATDLLRLCAVPHLLPWQADHSSPSCAQIKQLWNFISDSASGAHKNSTVLKTKSQFVLTCKNNWERYTSKARNPPNTAIFWAFLWEWSVVYRSITIRALWRDSCFWNG